MYSEVLYRKHSLTLSIQEVVNQDIMTTVCLDLITQDRLLLPLWSNSQVFLAKSLNLSLDVGVILSMALVVVR